LDVFADDDVRSVVMLQRFLTVPSM